MGDPVSEVERVSLHLKGAQVVTGARQTGVSGTLRGAEIAFIRTMRGEGAGSCLGGFCGFSLGQLISRHRSASAANQPICLFQNVGICRLFPSEEAEHHERCAK
jgi:hypothetical protein